MEFPEFPQSTSFAEESSAATVKYRIASSNIATLVFAIVVKQKQSTMWTVIEKADWTHGTNRYARNHENFD